MATNRSLQHIRLHGKFSCKLVRSKNMRQDFQHPGAPTPSINSKLKKKESNEI